MRGEFIDLDGARVYCYAAGTPGGAEPVVFLHGFPTSSHLWSGVVSLIPDGRRLIVADLLGYGRSDRPAGHDVSIPGHGARTLALLDALGINRACIVGHDVGGGIAQWLAVHAPTRVSRLCLVNSVGFDCWPARDVKLARATLPLTRFLPALWMLTVLRTDLLRGYSDRTRGLHSVEQYVRPFASIEGRDAFIADMIALDSRDTMALVPRLKNIVAPTAILCGAHDPFLSTVIGERLRKAIPGATLDVVPDARHFLPEESPEHVAAAITTLLAR
jgi:pimeloyl-ACP methyl ester carboxylesterase